MRDPFPIPPSPVFAELTTPLANALALPTLPLHIHELFLASFSYHLICNYVSPYVSTRLYPNVYPQLNPRTRLNWNVHVVSLVQSVVVCTLASWVILKDDTRRSLEWEGRVFGYSGAGGMIQALAAGYFLWDLVICAFYVNIFGWGLLAHAIAALAVFSLGFRPFINFYGPTFILYELSSPFLNLHWFFDKLQMTGSRPQWYNGLVLLSSFFCCRLVWGSYQSVRVFADIWAAIHVDQPGVLERTFAVDGEVMKYAKGNTVPPWLAIVYLGSNCVLNALNFYWFGKMIETIRKRFTETKKPKENGFVKTEFPIIDGLIKEADMVDGLVDCVTVVEGLMDGNIQGLMNEKGEIEVGKDGEKRVLKIHKTEVRRRKV